MKKLFILFALACTATTAALAEGYDYMVFRQSSGAMQSVDAMGLKIVFHDGQLIATPKSGEPLSIGLEEMAAMRFSTEAVTGIGSVKQQTSLSVQGRILVMALPSRCHAVVATPSGIVVAQHYTAGKAETFATRPLASGVYIVKTNNTTTKILVK